MIAYGKITIDGKLAKLISHSEAELAEGFRRRISDQNPGCVVVLHINPNA